MLVLSRRVVCRLSRIQLPERNRRARFFHSIVRVSFALTRGPPSQSQTRRRTNVQGLTPVRLRHSKSRLCPIQLSLLCASPFARKRHRAIHELTRNSAPAQASCGVGLSRRRTVDEEEHY